MVKSKTSRTVSSFLGVGKEPEEKPIKIINPLILHKPLNPKNSKKRLRLVLEGMHTGVESHYYWILRFMKSENVSFGMDMEVEKIKDLYTAAETSSYFGSIEQRKGMQQEKVTQLLGTIGNMTKSLFQIIRELRIMDERLYYYTESNKGNESAEIALKSIWTDMVEGGIKNPASVYGLAREVGFITLPDLFFKINPKDGIKGIEKTIKSLKEEGINRKVREVLSRKLFQYYAWKEKTNQEITTRRNFILKYLRQHYHTVKLYINWIRPYLENIKKLQMGRTGMDADIVTAFESSKIELELLGKSKGFKKYLPCLLVKFKYVAIPQMAYQQEYQKGAIHTGRTEIEIEPYVVTKEQIEEYIANEDKKDFEIIATLTSTMTALGDELVSYLKEAGEVIEEEKKAKKIEKEGLLTPFISVFQGFKEILTFGREEKKEKVGISRKEAFEEKKKAEDLAKLNAWNLYDIFKKAHKLYAP